ncbi:hypothetical protein [Lentilactobacillus kribbianus]|uniref:hypothetical protein n=1 Tax=Lentilactobacillus kribbianus TaxID=2729622 RepID=UPI0015532D26|nr:hypothetical protein [Lentilactobacillus kribbianus]
MTKNINKIELISNLKDTQRNLENFVRYEEFITSSFDLAGKGLDHFTDPVNPLKLSSEDLESLLDEWSNTIYQCKTMIVGLSDRLWDNDRWLRSLQETIKTTLVSLENGGDLDE